MTTTLISASAGTGKTYAICELIADRLINGLDPARLVATTFTRKAAAELAERIRARVHQTTSLSTQRRDEILDRLELAAIGTVHSVAHKFLRRHALQLGLSPRLEVLDEGEDSGVGGRHLSRLLQQCLPEGWDEYTAVCSRLSLNNPDKIALDLLQIARANALSASKIKTDLHASIKRWSAVIGKIYANFPDFEQLKDRAQKVLKKLNAIPDDTKTTQKTIESLQLLSRYGFHTWAEAAKLSTLAAGKRSGADDVLEDLRTLGRKVRQAPGLHEDLHSFAKFVGDVVAHLEETYTAYKQERGLADFTDLERIFLDLVRNPAMRTTLAAEIGCFVVDEFQDTNPIQLAIFRALQAVATETVWVGDRKQAIFGFRGTDAGLVDGVWKSVVATKRRLDTNYRSAPGVVAITNELFGPVFGTADVKVKAIRTIPSGRVECWSVSGNKDATIAALASGIASLLREDSSLRCSDIAVLVRSNHRLNAVAQALHHIGVPAVVPLPGLLKTREGAALLAGLRVVADRRDTLACAVLRHLLETDSSCSTPPWFRERLTEVAENIADREPFAGVALIESIAALDPAQMAPADLVLAVSNALDLPSRIAAWGDPQARAANLDAIVNLAHGYEEDARRNARPATPSGLVGYLEDLRDSDADTIPVPSDSDAVQILTYHKSKGLEWPIAICFDLGALTKSRLFSAIVEGGDPSADDPLKGRALRFWPWPFGFNPMNFKPIDCGTGLIGDAEASDEGQQDLAIQNEEDRRLLYVGCTRARDCLVLVLPEKGAEWLESLGAHVSVVLENGKNTGLIHGRACTESADQPEIAPSTTWIAEAPPASSNIIHPNRFASPSGCVTSTIAQVSEHYPTGAPVLAPIAKADPATLGSAVHAYLAGITARTSLDLPTRVTLAEESLTAWNIGGCLDSAGLSASADAFLTWIQNRWPGATIRTEIPVEGPRQDGGYWNGIIDTLILDSKGIPLALIDHKTTGGPKASPDDALEHAPQLAAYKEAIGQPLELWVHQVMAARMARISL